jgi:2-dehydro-3-deoxyglucarate aldolase/4-hydroxy-2-oxoheptanedioate aldolase
MERVKELLKQGRLVRVFGLGQILDPKIIQIVGLHGGYDGLWIDAEHVQPTVRELEVASLAAAASGLDCFVRLPATDYAAVMRPLEAGVGGVMISMSRSAADVERAVRWAKFYPRGERGLNGGNRDGRFGLEPLDAYVERVNRETFVGIQVETAGALEEIEAIAAVPDVDLLFIGPADLSQVLGVPGQFEHARCFEAIERVATVCERVGKPWGTMARNAEYAARMRNLGCRLFVVGFELHALHRGIRSIRADFGALWEG